MNTNHSISVRKLWYTVSRVLVSHLKFFNLTFEEVCEWHIKHPYYKEMSTKSVVVSLYLCNISYMLLDVTFFIGSIGCSTKK